MLENLLFVKRDKRQSNIITDFTIYSTSPSVSNANGASASWFGIHYVELLDKNGQPLNSYEITSATASSTYGAGYLANQATIRSSSYWCNQNSNNGNANKSLWIKVLLKDPIEVSGFRIGLNTLYVSRNLILETASGLVLTKTSSNVPVWPLLPMTNIGNIPVVEMLV